MIFLVWPPIPIWTSLRGKNPKIQLASKTLSFGPGSQKSHRFWDPMRFQHFLVSSGFEDPTFKPQYLRKLGSNRKNKHISSNSSQNWILRADKKNWLGKSLCSHLFTFSCNKNITNGQKMVCIQLQITYRFCRYLAIHSSFKNKPTKSSQRFVYICSLFCNET